MKKYFFLSAVLLAVLLVAGCHEVSQITADPNSAACIGEVGQAVARTGEVIATGGAASGNLSVIVVGALITAAGMVIGLVAKTTTTTNKD